ncbi:MAG: hypothetical protein A2Y62_06195 [Candidatus Fischerbacteria bacterium RBG_13_37_8]|uniref:Uncharacterized protein n=1 Tax=Candidatus Fischerbacteria bacterium RBG_13_37_8 TaxID=1817863 RepID=A0A1F5VVB6_9BACT|nr:MAG: hypothetical protein A2Y62_06195 [Candidatus Fischerbacteria bacterium RBG_13_37_8]
MQKHLFMVLSLILIRILDNGIKIAYIIIRNIKMNLFALIKKLPPPKKHTLKAPPFSPFLYAHNPLKPPNN